MPFMCSGAFEAVTLSPDSQQTHMNPSSQRAPAKKWKKTPAGLGVRSAPRRLLCDRSGGSCSRSCYGDSTWVAEQCLDLAWVPPGPRARNRLLTSVTAAATSRQSKGQTGSWTALNDDL
jgi:hypothetical protein